jgi:hypothetical protein
MKHKIEFSHFVKWLFIVGAAVAAGAEALSKQKQEEQLESIEERLSSLEEKEDEDEEES